MYRLPGLLDRLMTVFREIEPHVTHPSHLGDDRAEHPVIRVARVAVLVTEELISGVP